MQNLYIPAEAQLGFPSPNLRVFNAPTSFSSSSASSPYHSVLPPSHAKHIACSLSSQSACIFLSPSLLPIHVDALYASFLRTGPDYSQIVAAISSDDAYRMQHLRFENDQVDLHAAAVFSAVLGRDMQEHIVKRTHSKRFLKQIGTVNPDIPGDSADIFWSLWMNTAPELVGPIFITPIFAVACF